ncbi:MAG: class I SAM-dependent methyltransferase [Candidatus Nanoarchaeia archaeon]|jgi:2-polyprenyl-3-methyl-5-hydroxy-6-metoxy-1,4-benzoquinol methylase
MKNLQEYGNIESSLDYFLKFNIPKKAKILDIGCSYGTLINNLYKLGYKNVYGIDINKEVIIQGKKKYKFIKNRLKIYNGINIPFQNEIFDVILMFDVIEHIPQVEIFLKEQVFRILKKNRIFIFQTPNKHINIPWEIIQHKSFTKYKKYHCSLQTYLNLKKILIQSGFKDIKLEKYNIKTEHNINKIKVKLGVFGIFLLNIISIMPLVFQSNFFGSGRK